MSIEVFIDFPHGLGDCTQFSVVLKHLRELRQDWLVDVKVGRGKHSILEGLCRRVYHDQEPHPPRDRYRQWIDIGFFENYNRYPDCPNSKVTNCLREVFGLSWVPRLGRYEAATNPDAVRRARQYVISCGAAQDESGKYNVVVIHYEGNTSPTKKNLAHWQARTFVETVLAAGRIPIILDWDGRSILPDQKTVFNPGCGDKDIWGGFGSGDAATIRALIDLAQAFVGIDSGPGKVASATDTPTLICWRGHHPVQFHDPAINTLHLVPGHWRSIPPCDGEAAVQEFFTRHYRYQTYEGDHGLVGGVTAWLSDVLHMGRERPRPPVKFVTPNGIGDVMWALTKVKHIAAGRPVEIILSGDPRKELDRRAAYFLSHFPFVRSAEVLDVPVLHDREAPSDSRGRYNYVSDGPRGDYHYLVPNRTLESGRRLEDWLPEVPVDYDVVNDFTWEGTEKGARVGQALAPFVAFYLGPESGHTDEGHNKNWLWEPRHWVELGKAMKDRGHRVVVVGAHYDRSFWERYVQGGVQEAGLHWVDLVGKFRIGETFALLKEAKCLISYQCGLGIVGHYLGVNVAMWWRPDGNSLHPKHLICFDERMRHSWTRPGWEEKYMGLLYQSETPGDIMAEIDRRGWLK